ncbi:MAG: hypothetical protein IJ946_01455 [Clostridia bacterium]|nr:hypothetical protein [Clostridia bacterium]
MNKFKSIFTIVLAVLFVFGFTVASIIVPDKEISLSENSTLQQFPDLSVNIDFSKNILEELKRNSNNIKGFTENFEKYTQDQFPLRDSFRKLKADVVFNLLMQKDNNGYFVKNGYIFKNSNLLNSKNIDYNTNKIKFYYDSLLSDSNNVYLAVIPDKNYYLDDNISLRLNYDKFFDTVLNKLSFAKYIDLTDKLTLDSYYFTDTHWRQEKITDVADFILSEMGAENTEADLETVSTNKFFKGIYARQTFFKTEGDEMKYVINPVIKDAVLVDNGLNVEIPIYNFEKIESAEPYDMFMSYAKVGLVTLQRKAPTTGRELIVFRDSFGSSIGPLLLNGYDKITFIDTRQILPAAVKNQVEFTNQDVLFLYSTTVLNDTTELK